MPALGTVSMICPPTNTSQKPRFQPPSPVFAAHPKSRYSGPMTFNRLTTKKNAPNAPYSALFAPGATALNRTMMELKFGAKPPGYLSFEPLIVP